MHKKLIDFHNKFTMFKILNPQTKKKEDLTEKKLKTMLEISLMNFIMFTKVNTMEKKKFNYKGQKRNLTAKIETH